MTSTPMLINYLMVQAICRKAAVTERGTILSVRPSICLTGQKELAVTKEQIDALLKLLDKPDVGINDGYNPQSVRSNVLLVSVIPVPSIRPPLNFL